MATCRECGNQVNVKRRVRTDRGEMCFGCEASYEGYLEERQEMQDEYRRAGREETPYE